MNHDYYAVLGLDRDASDDQIKKAYRKLALKHHPDRNQGDKQAEEKFKEASTAYQVLSDPEKRARYDRFGPEAFTGPGGFGSFSAQDFASFAEDIFGDIFGSFFGGAAGGRRRPATGPDLRYSLVITLEEAAKGGDKEISLSRPTLCENCEGSGARKGTRAQTCSQCQGTGQVRIQQGFFAISTGCAACGGKGAVIADPCPSCGGKGRTVKEVDLSVKLPAGIDHGQALRLRGEGGAGEAGAPPGDLYVEISVKPHKVFEREGSDIFSEHPVSFPTAVLGGEVEVPTLFGKELLKIPAGTQSGELFRLPDKGIVDMRSGRYGDHHVRVSIRVPKKVNDRQRGLLLELAAIDQEVVSDEDRSFIDRVKDLFD